jgi:DNA-binding transcriptional MerR regulator
MGLSRWQGAPWLTVSAGNGHSTPGLRIGQVAAFSGMPVKTIRFYCDQGLIKPAMRSAGGYRLFDDSIYAELSLIRTLRAMDVPLPELQRIMEVRRSGICNCTSLKGSIQSKLSAIDQRLQEMAAMRQELAELLEQWQDCGGSKPSAEAGT